MQEYLNLFFLGHEMLTQPIDSLPKAPSCTLALEGGYLVFADGFWNFFLSYYYAIDEDS